MNLSIILLCLFDSKEDLLAPQLQLHIKDPFLMVLVVQLCNMLLVFALIV